ncbi:MAG: thioredoxin [Thermoplasmata archaeon]|nr:MAG: thioredoxin [Thermoplasmata archaeon]
MKELNQDEFDDFLGKNRIAVVDFWAPWCMPCLAMAPILEELDKELNDIAFAKVNVDKNVDLARQYGIMSIPTIIIFVNGREVDRIIGMVPKEELKERILTYSGSFLP